MDFEGVDLVVQGYDDKINLFKLCFASYAIQKGAFLLSTNSDRATKSPAFADLKIIGNGSFTKLLESATDTKAVIAGKPNPIIFELISTTHGVDFVDLDLCRGEFVHRRQSVHRHPVRQQCWFEESVGADWGDLRRKARRGPSSRRGRQT